MTTTKTGTYEGFGQEPVRNPGRTGRGPILPSGRALELAGLGELDLDPEFDLRKHRVQPGVARRGLQIGGGIAEPADGDGIEIAGEQPDLEIVEHVERALAAGHRAPAPFGRVVFDALKRQQRVDAGSSLRRGRAAGFRGGSHVIRQREAGRAGPPGIARRRSDRGAVRSVDAHRRPLWGADVFRASFAVLWLMRRKRPGKNCRMGPVFASARLTAGHRHPDNTRTKSTHYDVDRAWHGARIVNRGSMAMGVAKRSHSIEGSIGMPGIHVVRFARMGCAALVALALSAMSAQATSRIKDLANIEGVRQNQLIGYGLVVGLNGTGDTLNNIPFTKQSLQAMLERMGVNIRGATIRTGNVAAVMVTGNLPPFATQGTRMDVTVSALGDAKNLQGGTLLVTPLLGADGNVYAVAQGSLAISGFQAEGQAAKITQGVPTVGRIANGAIIEREIEFALNRLPNVRLALRNADFTTAKRIAAAVNDYLGVKTAEPIDPSTVQLSIPSEFKGNVVAFLTEIEQLQVDPDLAAKIVIDERSGIIVMGRDVRVNTVAVAQGNLTVTISESPQVSQPNPLSRGRTVVTPRTSVGVTEDGKKFAVVKDGVSLQQLVDGLNGLGIGPRDLIGILQAIKAAGAIQADIEVMCCRRKLP